MNAMKVKASELKYMTVLLDKVLLEHKKYSIICCEVELLEVQKLKMLLSDRAGFNNANNVTKIPPFVL